MKKFLALLAVLALCLTPALADEALSMLPAVNDYAAADYADVPQDSWFAAAAQVCYETGLMTGTQNGFEPELTLSGGQLAAIAARIREAVVGDTIPSPTPAEGADLPWYADYTLYLEEAGVDLPDPEQPASRLDFVRLLCAVLPESYTPAINAVTALPDTDSADALRLYNAGILTGSDVYGTFLPAGTLHRHECAVMVARAVRPDLRVAFTLQPLPAQTGDTDAYEAELMETEAVRVNGVPISFETYLSTLNTIIFRTDFGMAANGGARLDWDAQYQGVDDLEQYFKDQATSTVVQDYLAGSRANALGCTVDDLAATLTPDPSALLDQFYLAKHILVADETTAVSLLTQLMNAPSMELFDQLLDTYGTDPGMKSNPYGYLFTSGEMVSEFENAVKSLRLNSCSSVPVKSQFGWHIILRLDPTDYPNWASEIQSKMYESYMDDWMTSSTITLNEVELGKLDVRARYAQYLDAMGMT